MRKLLPALLLLSLISFPACKKGKKPGDVKQDITYQEELPIPFGSDPPYFVNIDTSMVFAIPTDYQGYLNQYNTSSDKVIHAKLKELSFRITTPPDQFFNFVDSMKVYLLAPGLPEILTATKNPVPKNTQYFALDVVDVNLKEYFLNDTMYIRVRTRINQLTKLNTKIQYVTVFELLANPLN